MVFLVSQFAKEQKYKVESHESVDSTNRLALDIAKSDKNIDKLWIVANEQTQGRARRGRSWSSPKGNLYTSLLLSADIIPESAANLGFVAGVSMAEALNKILIDEGFEDDCVKLKWPNDILLKGAKSSGILLELAKISKNQYALIIGIGLNVKHNFEDAPYPTQSLKKIGIEVDCEKVFLHLSQYFAINYLLFQTEAGAQSIREKWLKYAAFIGGAIKITSDNAMIEGVFNGIDENFNCLILDNNQKEIKITAGDVHFGTVASQVSTLY